MTKRSTAAVLALCLAVLLPSTPRAGAAVQVVPPGEATGIFEIRIYSVRPGAMETFVAWMREVHTLQESLGMRILAHFADAAQNKYVWIRIHDDEAARQRTETALAGSTAWKQLASRRREAGMEGAENYFATPTRYSHAQYSWARWAFEGGPSVLSSPSEYEVRVYAARPGEMDGLVTWMGEKMVPFQETHGIRVPAQFRVYAREVGPQLQPESNLYIWMRAFPDQATKEAMSRLTQDRERMAAVGRPVGLDKGLAIISGRPTPFSRLQ